TTTTDDLAARALNFGPVDLLLVCINGRLGNMSATEAAKLASEIRPRLAVPIHYGMFPNNTADPDTFTTPLRRAGLMSDTLEVGARVSIADLLGECAGALPFDGVVPPVVTPLRPDETLDEEALRRLIAKLVKAGCGGLFFCGTAGLGPSLSDAVFSLTLEVALEATPDGVAAMAGVMEPSTARAKERLRRAGDIGYTYAVLAAPTFLPPRKDSEFLAHFGECQKASALKLIAYNLPSYTRCSIPVNALLAMHSRGWIHAVKESSGDALYFADLCQRAAAAGLPVFQGNRPEFAHLAQLGAVGIVPVPSNLDPELYVRAWKARNAAPDKIAAFQSKSDALWHSLVDGYDFLSGILQKLGDEGIGTGHCPLPWTQ
ncbi:MAG: dihydrodipicolinate synthase family protein, partial [Opitutales bacterium]